MDKKLLNALKQVADGVAAQFGNNCEVAIYDPGENNGYSVVYAVNENVSGQGVGTQENRSLLEKRNLSSLETRGHISYLVKTPEGRVLKNSAVCIRNEQGDAEAVVTIKYDVTELVTLENAIHDLISTENVREKESEPVLNVNELLEQLIQKSVELVGKPVARKTCTPG